MIKQIPRPKKITDNYLCGHDIFYYDDIDNIYIIECSNFHYKYYYNKYLILSRRDGPAYSQISYPLIHNGYYLNGNGFTIEEFAKKTNHLICEYCENFCKQGCFY